MSNVYDSDQRSTTGTGVPSVVAVVVTSNAGKWFVDTLRSLARQDYSNLAVLIIDNASRVDPTSMVAAVLPDAFVTRVETDGGFGAAANRALGMVKGANFYLFLHDDVALDPGATRSMVEEAFRSNAGVVGGKVVDWKQPDVLLDMGWAVDRYGFRTPVAEPGELDQAQHDSVRDTFAVSDTAMLVRADLFEAIGGFDTKMAYYEADVDLCWRAHIAGARVIVTPAAKIAHRLEGRRADRLRERRQMEYRGRGRMLLTNYSFGSLLKVLPAAALLSILELLATLLSLQFAKAADIAAAWGWNLLHLPGTLAARRRLAKIRRVPDREIRRYQVAGSASITAFLRGTVTGGSDRINQALGNSRGVIAQLREGPDQLAVLVWVGLIVTLLIGTRGLFGSGLPALREFSSTHRSATSLLSEYMSHWRLGGLGSDAAAPTLVGLHGLLGFVLLGSVATAHWLLVVGTLPLGIAGIWWAARGSASSQTRAVMLLAYTVSPVPYNALAEGRWSAAAVWAALPWLVGILGRAAGAAPFADLDRPLRFGRAVAMAGVTIGLAFAITPAIVIPLAALVVCLLGGAALAAAFGQGADDIAPAVRRGSAGTDRESRARARATDTSGSGGHLRWDRAASVAAGGLILGLALNLPWVLSLATGGNLWDQIVGPWARAGKRLAFHDLLLAKTGPNGLAWLSIGLLTAGVLAVLVGNSWRLRLAIQGWLLALVGWGLAIASQARFGLELPSTEMLLAITALGLALAAGASMAAFERDVSGGDFGWRQGLSIMSAVLLAVACTPVLLMVTNGRWYVPRQDHGAVLDTFADGTNAGQTRTLWLGDGDVLPLGGWELSDGTRFATTVGMSPTVGDRWPGSDSAGTDALRGALESAISQRTSRLGSMLAPLGIRYVVVVHRAGPSSIDPVEFAPGRALLSAIARQSDLSSVPATLATDVYEVPRPTFRFGTVEAGAFDDTESWPSSALSVSTATAKALGPVPTYSDGLNATAATGRDVYLPETASARRSVTIDGKKVSPKGAFGFASVFPVASGGKVSIERGSSLLQQALVLFQIAAIVLCILAAWSRAANGPGVFRLGAESFRKRRSGRSVSSTADQPTIVLRPADATPASGLTSSELEMPAGRARPPRRVRPDIGESTTARRRIPRDGAVSDADGLDVVRPVDHTLDGPDRAATGSTDDRGVATESPLREPTGESVYFDAAWDDEDRSIIDGASEVPEWMNPQPPRLDDIKLLGDAPAEADDAPAEADDAPAEADVVPVESIEVLALPLELDFGQADEGDLGAETAPSPAADPAVQPEPHKRRKKAANVAAKPPKTQKQPKQPKRRKRDSSDSASTTEETER